MGGRVRNVTSPHTEAGWDLLEPVTYFAGLTAIMGGYLWFLYMRPQLQGGHGRDGVETAGDRETVAVEYDVDWDEMNDMGEEGKEVLDNQKGKGRTSKEDEEEGEAEDERGEAEVKDVGVDNKDSSTCAMAFDMRYPWHFQRRSISRHVRFK